MRLTKVIAQFILSFHPAQASFRRRSMDRTAPLAPPRSQEADRGKTLQASGKATGARGRNHAYCVTKMEK